MKRDRAFAAAALAALLTAGTAAAQQQARPPHTIRVSATGESRATPDRAWVDFGVETEGATARAASEENARRMEPVIAALVAAGVPRANVQTRDYNVFPVYEPNPRGEGDPRVRGYRVTNTVSVQTDDVRRVGALIDAALTAGANRVNGVRFGLRDPDRARAEAIRDAIQRARAEASALAGGLGVQLGDVIDATTTDVSGPPMPVMFRREAMAADASTPIEPGQQTVTATVSLVYEIAR